MITKCTYFKSTGKLERVKYWNKYLTNKNKTRTYADHSHPGLDAIQVGLRCLSQDKDGREVTHEHGESHRKYLNDTEITLKHDHRHIDDLMIQK